MSGLTPLQKTGNLFSVASNIGSGLCALGQVLRAADVAQIDDVTLCGLGYLLDTVGGQLLEVSDAGHQIANAPQD